MNARSRYDVVIAGARVAGASTALLLARAGLDVLVVDPVPQGRDTLSTHALMRGAVQQLARWGVLDAIIRQGTPRVEWTTFHYGDEFVRVPIQSQDDVDGLYAPRRTVLDSALVDAARSAGATFAFGWSVRDLVLDGTGRVRGVEARSGAGDVRTIEADVVIGADGRNSRIARIVQAPVTRREPRATASIYGYWPGLDRDEYHWHYRNRESIGTIPTNGGVACVFASVSPHTLRDGKTLDLPRLHAEAVRRVSPEVFERTHAQGPGSGLRAFAGAPGFMRRPWGPGWALVGDAGYFKDPLTAHGITDALRDAELLATAVLAGTDEAYAAYESTRDRLSDELFRLTGEIAGLRWELPELQALHLELSRVMKEESLELARARSEETPAPIAT